jgi:hypothetical protein
LSWSAKSSLPEDQNLSKVGLHLKDYSGRDFGGEFEAVGLSVKDGKVFIELLYCGTKSSKRLSVAAVSIDQSVLDRLKLL